MAKCRVCNIEKDLTYFYIKKNSKSGYDNRCKSCKREYDKRYHKPKQPKQSKNEKKEKEKLNKAINQKKYPHLWARRAAKYRARKRNQTPNLTTEEKERIRLIYESCRNITQKTGINHHVDHIIPLSKGGLHHPDNLQVLTAEENFKKGSKE